MKKLGLLTTLLAAGLMASSCSGAGGITPGGRTSKTSKPTSAPTSQPTTAPTSAAPTSDPTSVDPTSEPTSVPTSVPTSESTSVAPSIPDDVAEQVITYAQDRPIASVSRKTDLLFNQADPTPIGSNPGKDGAEATWNNDYLYLATSQLESDDDDNDYIVNIAWDYESPALVKEALNVDATHVAVYFNYSETEELLFNFTGTLSLGNVSHVLNYSVKLHNKNIKFMELSLQEIYAVNSDDTNFELVDPAKGWYKPNNTNFDYACVETYGEVLYTSPDGNWALIGAGDKVLQLYSGSARNLKPDTFPALVVGNPVIVGAELGSYKGNCQVSFIFYIVQGDATKYDAPVTYSQLTGDMFAGKGYWQGGIMNGLFTANAVYAGNLKNSSGTAVEAENLSYGRFTFDATIDGQKIQVAYDYHCDYGSTNHPIFDAFKEKIKTLSVGSGLTLKGTVRFAGTTEKTYLDQPLGSWSIVPFLADHIA